MWRKYTQEEFLKKAKETHGDKYDYSKVEYVDSKTKVCITCPIHGDFLQTPNNHLMKRGCPLCAKNSKLTSDIIERKIKECYGNLYEYEIPNEINSRIKIKFICKEHGIFYKRVDSIKEGHGCPLCSKYNSIKYDKDGNIVPNKTYVTETFIEEAKKIWKDKIDYSNTIFNGMDKFSSFFCNKHQIEFQQIPRNHLKGLCGCKECKRERQIENSTLRLGKEELLNRFKKIHGDKYEYLDINDYTTRNSIISIKCDKHGIFKQRVDFHLIGCGCPKCNESHLEKKVRLLFDNIQDLEYIYNDRKTLNGLELDFYIPKLKLAIECQGIQHFKIGWWQNTVEEQESNFIKQQERDKLKKELCKNKGITLIYFLDKKHEKYMDKDDIYFIDMNLLYDFVKNIQ